MIAGAALAASACQGEVREADTDMAEPSGPVINLTLDDLLAAQDAGDIRLIDVRTDEEVAQGMIPGAQHIALNDLAPSSMDLSDGREVVFYCHSGFRSANAATRLSMVTGEPVRHFEGGIVAWQEAGQPLSVPAAPR